MWAMTTGVHEYPERMAECIETSNHGRRLSHSKGSEKEATFDLTTEEGKKDCFQCLLHKEGSWKCPKPCDPQGKKTPHCGLISGHEEHDHGYVALLFLLGGLTTGCFLQLWQERVLPQVPYTCLLFLAGLGFAGIHKLRHLHGSEKDWGNWFVSVDMWEKVNPHLVFYIFLPLLIFSEAMKLNISMALRIVGQVLLMATIGVIVGTVLTATYAFYCFPYEWSIPVALLFGSILAATDPVAVVALFNTLGVSPKLTMLISGESLLNDGTAIVVFGLLMILVKGGDLTVALVSAYFFKMTLVSVLLGMLLSLVAMIMLGWCCEAGYHSDAMIQVCVTLLLSMFCFFLAEAEAGGWTPAVDGQQIATSGVLTVVSAGCCVSYFAWPTFVSREVMHIVWEAVEFMGNTMVFLLAGLLWGYEILDDYHQAHITRWDVLHLLGLYAALHVIRGIMVCCFWPFLNCIGEKITWKEALVMTWSGLRGAVGLILAIIVDEEREISKKIGAKFLFHIGGIAMMTISINATLCPFLLDKLKLTRPKGLSKKSAEHFEHQLVEYAKKKFDELKKNGDDNIRWKNVTYDDVQKLLPLLEHPHAADADKPIKEEAEERAYREVFLRFVQKEYWTYLEEGQIPRRGRVARVLLLSCADGLLKCNGKLSDWTLIKAKSGEWQLCPCLNRCLENIWPFSQWYWMQSVFPSSWTISMWKAYLTICFLEAHAKAREKIPPFFEESGSRKVFQQQTIDKVHRESLEQAEAAKEYQASFDQKAVLHAKNRMVAGRLLMKKREETDLYTHLGVLPDKAASHLLHEIHHQTRQLARGNMYEPE
jgi:NhaP-type Na+/H+ or K+/H+ antiporter